MYNTVIGVGAAVLVGGVALYTGYQMTRGDADEAGPRTEVAAADRAAREAASPARDERGRRGVPTGERALDFAEGAEGERIEREADEIAAAMAEADRLDALGAGGVVGELDDADAADRLAAQAAQTGRAASDMADESRRALDAGADADFDPDLALGAADPALPRTQIAAAGDGDDIRDAAQDGTSAAPTRGGLRGAIAAGDGAIAAADRPPAIAANPVRADKPDTVRNAALVDKPDTRTARLIDKPDNSPSFAANDPGRRFDPCTKADGTPYVGPGTAINPFADGDPCLPKATGQAFEVAALAPPRAPLTASTVGQRGPRILPFVDLVRPGFVAAPPVGGNFGSDYAD